MSKILLVEDDELESRLYINLFTKSGYEVVAIPNGESCYAKTKTIRPDVVILDIMMPKMNGFDTLDVLHFDPDTAKIPIIVLTNLSDEHYKTESLKRGAALFLTKSNIGNQQLLQHISDIIHAYSVNVTH